MKSGSDQMAALIFGLADQIRSAWELGEERPTLSTLPPEQPILLVGMGGSALGAEIAQALLADELDCPVILCRGGGVPRWLGTETTVLVVSYSGNTVETLRMLEEARERGAEVGVVTSGGRLLELAQKVHLPMVRVPSGLPPRAAVAYLAFGCLHLLSPLWDREALEPQVDEAVSLLQELRVRLEAEDGPAATLAAELVGRLPMIYSGEVPYGLAARRWTTQLAENAKVMAHYNLLPEMAHNEVEGWSDSSVLERARVVLLDGSDLSARDRAGLEALRDLFSEQDVQVTQISAEGDTLMGRLFHLLFWGDAVSFHLSRFLGVDPLPVSTIQRLKDRLGSL